MFPQTRLRRLRKNAKLRQLVQETYMSQSQLIWPCFVVEGRGVQEPIPSMPGQFHYSADTLAQTIKEKLPKNLGGVLIFGVPSQKSSQAKEATRKDSLVAQAIQEIKSKSPETFIVTDVCLCAYTDHGHCGLLNAKGEIENDASLEVLATMALRHAEAGADMIAPSDMLDGRIKIIRAALDENQFKELPIMSYAAKYASSFYGPFRDAAHSAPTKGDRKSYQLNPSNIKEAMREMHADVEEGADILMVKPALPYLDVIAEAKKNFDLPIAAYQISGEYAMIKAAVEKNLMDEKQAVLETLISMRRAGASILITYFANQLHEFR